MLTPDFEGHQVPPSTSEGVTHHPWTHYFLSLKSFEEASKSRCMAYALVTYAAGPDDLGPLPETILKFLAEYLNVVPNKLRNKLTLGRDMQYQID
ncbi:hypothetical protein Nepgr_001897 [Nepenthes gracilis]|uniref:Uncharacterized protein n=1 Tax=Nepenthes gracilis TaxID=150966 RepID=A0AAD3P5Y0_NEPGR|nr:hypothetical protein Nepgr_001897 [Nepenthes gracilis]